MNKKSMVWIIVFFLLISFVYAVPPVTQMGEGNGGFTIEYPKYEFVKLGDSFELNIHVFNTSDGIMVGETEGVSCLLHIYNSSGQVVVDEMFTRAGHSYSLFLEEGNFSQQCRCAYLIHCNSSDQGGFASGQFEVTGEDFLSEFSSDSTSGIAIVVFILFITTLSFYVSFRKDKITEAPIGNLIIRRGAMSISIFTLLFNSAIVAQIAAESKMDLLSEIFTYMWIFQWAGYIALVVLMIKTLFDVMELYQEIIKKKRMGL